MPQVSCPHCGQPYEIPPEQWPLYEGRQITCTRCNRAFPVVGAGPGNVAPPPAPVAQAGIPPAGLAPGGMPPPGYPPAAGYPGPGGAYVPQKQGMGGGKIALIVVAAVLIPLILIGVIIGAILTPALGRAREAANRAKCANNMRQIALACMMYANDQKDEFPDKLERLVNGPAAQELEPNVFVCPAGKETAPNGSSPSQFAADLSNPAHLSYLYMGANLRSTVSPRAVLLYEPLGEHRDGANFAFTDATVTFVPKARAQKIEAELNQGLNPPPSAAGL